MLLPERSLVDAARIPVAALAELADREIRQLTDACRLRPLICLAPDIVEAILDERQPKGLRLAEMPGDGQCAGMSSGASSASCAGRP